MNSRNPVYTLKNECHDCYKCIRECFVKAIRIENGYASIIPEKCITCGHCVLICPVNAKKTRDDLSAAKELLRTKKNVYVSLAPSWTGLFDFSAENLIESFKKLGVQGVSETALGAQEVSAGVARMLSSTEKGLFISSACPVMVDFIRLYMPQYTSYITPLPSPALTHAAMIKTWFGEDTGIIFVGPCIAKKNEADHNTSLIDVSLTFTEMINWFKSENIDPWKKTEGKSSSFIPESSFEGSLYPLEGGMNETLKRYGCQNNVRLINISSIKNFKKALEGLDPSQLQQPVFIEALACEGGCANGPGVTCSKPGISVISNILSATRSRKITPLNASLQVNRHYRPNPVEKKEYSPEKIKTAMESIGKYGIEDELNCGGCGYDTCRKLAEALIDKEAEPSMCVSNMRRIALKKANAILRCMPSAVVIVDSALSIVEANDAFAKMFAGELYDFFKSRPEGMCGAALEKMFPCRDIFETALNQGSEIHREHYPVNEKLYDISVFSIEQKQIVGAVITDVTKNEMRRDQIARRAQKVIKKNISVVQEIASLLGEHMADTEMLLSSIAEGYETGKKRPPHEN